MSHFRNFLVGKESITSRKEFKYAMLRGQFACIICSVALFYTILDSINGVKVFIPWYGLLAGLALVSLFLNRKKYYTAATILQLILINSLIFLFADVDHPYGGVFFFFMTCSSAGLILLNVNDKAIIEIELVDKQFATIQIIDINGRVIEIVTSSDLSSGVHQFDLASRNMQNGVYFCRLLLDGQSVSKAFVVNN